MTTTNTASTRLDMRLTAKDRRTLKALKAALASPHLPTPPTAADVIRAALGSLADRLGVSVGPQGA